MQANKNITELYLQNNLLQDVYGCFRHLRYLKVLFLQSNQLTNINNVTNELVYLKYLENLSEHFEVVHLENKLKIVKF